MDQYEKLARELRGALHKIPEASMREYKTKQAVLDWLKQETALEIVDCGNWFYAKYTVCDGPYLALRADYDAVTGEDGVMRHLCGHDGHTAVLASHGKWISDTKPNRNIILLFQPGEESGEGGPVCKKLFELENVGEIYGFHNIPQKPLGQILIREKTFACASVGVEIVLKGAPAHAAYPEAGINPGKAIGEILREVYAQAEKPHKGIAFATLIGIDAGSEGYGVSASEGTVRFTVRAEYGDEFETLLAAVEDIARSSAQKYGLNCEILRHDLFPATENHKECVQKLIETAGKAGLSLGYPEEPFRWSEDFGWYLKEGKGAFYGIGDGENWPQLHTQNYEFNDELIPYAHRLLRQLCGE